MNTIPGVTRGTQGGSSQSTWNSNEQQQPNGSADSSSRGALKLSKRAPAQAIQTDVHSVAPTITSNLTNPPFHQAQDTTGTGDHNCKHTHQFILHSMWSKNDPTYFLNKSRQTNQYQNETSYWSTPLFIGYCQVYTTYIIYIYIYTLPSALWLRIGQYIYTTSRSFASRRNSKSHQ
jgi:hypothetical protein